MRQFNILLFLLFSSTVTLCQNFSYFKEVKEFFDNDGLADDAEATYYLIGKRTIEISNAIESLDSYIDTVYTFYLPSNARRSIEVHNLSGKLHGRFITFHKSGTLKEKGNYSDGKRVGYFTSWYPNGKVHRTLQYSDSTVAKSLDEIFDYKIINYFDSLGNPIIINGKGNCQCYLGSDLTKEVGKVNDGFKDSLWRGYENNRLRFEERYSKGNFIKGVGYDGRTPHSYDRYQISAKFPGGIDEFTKFARKNLRIPPYARKKGMKGKVYIRFCIEKDGSLSGIKIIESVHESASREALRVIGLMPNWIPRRVRGVPVKSTFVLPIAFKVEINE